MNRLQPADSKFLKTSFVVIALIIVSLVPRIYELGKIGFQKDEEYTAFSSMAIIEGKSAEMPSGMPYRRALPLTYLTAGTAKLFGPDNESSYRLPTAIICSLSPAILFLLFRSTIGGVTALVAALMLAFSEWHILVSREARMYAPYLLFYTCTALYCWQWIETNKRQYLLACIAFFAISVTFHKLTIMAAIFLLIPLVTNTRTAVPPIRALGLSAIFITLGFLYHKFFVGAGYGMFLAAESVTEANNIFERRYTKVLNNIPIINPAINLLLLVAGALAGYWFFDEVLGLLGLIGALPMLFGCILSQLPERDKKKAHPHSIV